MQIHIGKRSPAKENVPGKPVDDWQAHTGAGQFDQRGPTNTGDQAPHPKPGSESRAEQFAGVDFQHLASSVSRYSSDHFAARVESRMQGSSPPAVSGETAPAASPISSPSGEAMLGKTPPTGIRPPRRSIVSALHSNR